MSLFNVAPFYCRSHAIACVNQFIISRTQALMLHIDPFIEVSDLNIALPQAVCLIVFL